MESYGDCCVSVAGEIREKVNITRIVGLTVRLDAPLQTLVDRVYTGDPRHLRNDSDPPTDLPTAGAAVKASPSLVPETCARSSAHRPQRGGGVVADEVRVAFRDNPNSVVTSGRAEIDLDLESVWGMRFGLRGLRLVGAEFDLSSGGSSPESMFRVENGMVNLAHLGGGKW